MFIKFGSFLFSKFRKEYWKFDYVKGNVFIFVIVDFYDD